VKILVYLDAAEESPHQDWFDSIDAQAVAKVAIAITRIELGNLSNVKGVGSGVQEYRLDDGPGYRIYFGKDGDRLVILWEERLSAANRRTSRKRSCGGLTRRSAKTRKTREGRLRA
jgi:putative addiction module killer protein